MEGTSSLSSSAAFPLYTLYDGKTRADSCEDAWSASPRGALAQGTRRAPVSAALGEAVSDWLADARDEPYAALRTARTGGGAQIATLDDTGTADDRTWKVRSQQLQDGRGRHVGAAGLQNDFTFQPTTERTA